MKIQDKFPNPNSLKSHKLSTFTKKIYLNKIKSINELYSLTTKRATNPSNKKN